MQTSSWFVGSGEQSSRLRVYCFPHAGGSAGSFISWQGKLGSDVDVCPVELPGRGGRFGETSYDRMEPLADALCDEITRHARQPFAFFGHSMGALLAFETARRLESAGGRVPQLLVASGSNAPSHRPPSRKLYCMSDSDLIAALSDLNGTPSELLSNRGLMRLLLPTMRADFAVVETYSYSASAPLSIPIVVFAGRADKVVRRSHIERWRDQTTASFDLQWFDGDHFFVHSAEDEVMRQLSIALASVSHVP